MTLPTTAFSIFGQLLLWFRQLLRMVVEDCGLKSAELVQAVCGCRRSHAETSKIESVFGSFSFGEP